MSGRLDRRDRRSTEKQIKTEINSLADSSTSIDSEPIEKTNIPEDNIQDSKLPSVQEENIVTAPAATIQQDKDHSSDSSSDSNTSEIKRRKIHITTEKKK